MIKINLLQSRGVNTQSQKFEAGGGLASEFGQGEYLSGEDAAIIRREAIKNLFIIFLGSIGLLVYEQMNLPELRAQLQQINSELLTLTEKNLKAKEAVEQTRLLKREQEILQAQINAIENLKKDRSKIVKILELIQKNIPANVWFNELDFAMGRVTLMGYGITDSDVTNLLDVLSKSIYFREVNLVRSTEFNSKQFGLVRKIEVSCLLETNL
jgi:Tfp pilus assembly protein PilN